MGWHGLDGPWRACPAVFSQADADQPSDPHHHERESCRLGDTGNLVDGSGRENGRPQHHYPRGRLVCRLSLRALASPVKDCIPSCLGEIEDISPHPKRDVVVEAAFSSPSAFASSVSASTGPAVAATPSRDSSPADRMLGCSIFAALSVFRPESACRKEFTKLEFTFFACV
jgi:hypothetical protein